MLRVRLAVLAIALLCARSASADPFRAEGLQLSSRVSSSIPSGSAGWWNSSADGFPRWRTSAGADVSLLYSGSNASIVDLTVTGSFDCSHRQYTSTPVTLSSANDCIAGINVASAATVNLPAPVNGLEIIVKDESGAAATNNITMQASGGANIDNATTRVINQNYGAVLFYSDSSKWYAVADNGTLATAYLNGGAGPQIITLDSTRLGIRIHDASPTINGTLFMISDNTESSLYLRLTTGGPFQLRSPSPNTATGFIFDTVQNYAASGAPVYLWKTANNALAWLLVNSASQNEIDYFGGTSGTIVGSIVADTSTSTGLALNGVGVSASLLSSLAAGSTRPIVIGTSGVSFTNGEPIVSLVNNNVEFMSFESNSSGPLIHGSTGTEIRLGGSLAIKGNGSVLPSDGAGGYSDNVEAIGSPSNHFKSFSGYWYEAKVGAQLTAAATITPTSCIHHVTGATTISTIATTNVPSGGNVLLFLIADSAFTTSTGGNIAVGSSVAINKLLVLVWDNTAAKWFPIF
ncbi:MAG TPA: hypothetical protein VJ891_11270 [Casimicrobiaceae bacterium]|nr:hypothetical protein [Casimicrobiaceae bacterium]